MKVLVTGGTGFIGSTLIERLRSRGDEVTSVAKDRLNLSLLEALGVQVVLGDLNEANGWDRILAGVECVYHLAGVTRAQSSREYYEGNHLATRRLLELCLQYCPGLERFLYVSSLAAVGPALNSEPVEETTPYHPVSHYCRSKMQGEMEVLQVHDRLPVTIVRPSAVYGPRERDMYEYTEADLPWDSAAHRIPKEAAESGSLFRSGGGHPTGRRQPARDRRDVLPGKQRVLHDGGDRAVYRERSALAPVSGSCASCVALRHRRGGANRGDTAAPAGLLQPAEGEGFGSAGMDLFHSKSAVTLGLSAAPVPRCRDADDLSPVSREWLAQVIWTASGSE